MAEIDFDELDKAVSSLMENVKKPNQQPTSETSDVSADTSQDDDEASHSGQVDETTEVSESTQPDTDATAPEQTATPTTPSEGEESTAPRPSLANKRRGQFMDMKHASADMRAVPTAVKPMSRIGASLAPISSITKSDDDTEQKESTESRPTFTESPRDNHSDSSQPQEDDTLLLPASYEYENDVEKASGVRDEDDDKPTSPFLSDAKVEKRPLGAPSPLINDNETVDSSNQDDQDADAPAEERPLTHGTELSVSSESIAPAASPSKLPKELHSSVLEVEADTTAIDTKSRGSTDQDQSDEDSKFDSSTKPDDTNDSEMSENVETSTEKLAPTSIPPQYTAKKTGDDTGPDEPQVSMYDTAVDHPTLTQPKKTSHWAIAIVIIILVLLGALAGAALYLYQTGTLSLV